MTEELLSLGYSHRKIAQRLGRHRSSIDREIHRNATSEGYGGEHAQIAYSTRRKHSRKRTDELGTTITEKL